jgi:hypothetical protein
LVFTARNFSYQNAENAICKGKPPMDADRSRDELLDEVDQFRLENGQLRKLDALAQTVQANARAAQQKGANRA